MKSKIWESRPDLSHFQWISHCKWFRTLDTPTKSRLQICRAIIFDPRGSWKLIFGDCVAQGHCLKFSEPIFIFSIFSPKIFRFLKIRYLKTPKFRPIIGFPIVTKTRKSAQKCNFRFFGVPNNPGPHCSHDFDDKKYFIKKYYFFQNENRFSKFEIEKKLRFFRNFEISDEKIFSEKNRNFRFFEKNLKNSCSSKISKFRKIIFFEGKYLNNFRFQILKINFRHEKLIFFARDFSRQGMVV